MIKGLGDKFEDEKSDVEKEEMKRQGAYDLMIQDVLDQIDNGKEAADEKAAIKSEKEQGKAAAEGDLADTKATLAEDQKFLKDLESGCESKSVDYEKRQVLRAGEIEAIKKAIEIMSSDKVAGGTQHLPGLVQTGFAADHYVGASFAQIANKVSETEQNVLQSRVAQFLKGRAEYSGSRILAL